MATCRPPAAMSGFQAGGALSDHDVQPAQDGGSASGASLLAGEGFLRRSERSPHSSRSPTRSNRRRRLHAGLHTTDCLLMVAERPGLGDSDRQLVNGLASAL